MVLVKRPLAQANEVARAANSAETCVQPLNGIAAAILVVGYV